MSIEQRTLVNQIEVAANNCIQVRFECQLLNGDKVTQSKWHRTLLAPDTPVDAQLAAVNENLAAAGDAQIEDPDGVARLHKVADAIRTPEVIAAYQAELAAARAATIPMQVPA